MQFELKSAANSQELWLTGRFTFTDYASFRKLVGEVVETRVPKIVVDLSRVDFMDSAALGMLLLARDEASRRNQSLILRGAKGQVKRVLEVARFDSMFVMEN